MSNYNSNNTAGRRHDNVADLLNVGAVGDWAFAPDGEPPAIWIRTPDGSQNGTVGRLPITADSAQGGWQWDGNRDAPTLSPSIHRLALPGYKPGWHGFMLAGRLESC